MLKIDRENERFSLGIKQLTPDPWQEAVTTYPVGSKVDGKITNVTDFGIFVEVEDGIEGLVHVSEISKEKVGSPVGMYNVGDTIETQVISVSPKDRKIGLSIKALTDDSSNGTMADLAQQEDSGPSTLGDLLKNKLDDQESD